MISHENVLHGIKHSQGQSDGQCQDDVDDHKTANPSKKRNQVLTDYDAFQVEVHKCL